MTPLPNLQCPLCGGLNGCVPAQCGRFEVDCWCMRLAIPADTLALVPEASRGIACLCVACATQPRNGVTSK